MQDLRVIGVENGALLVASDEGGRFRIPIDEVLQSKLRQSVPEPGVGRKLSPKDIQSHIRSGMSAQDVAAITGVPLEYIQKFEGPVLAEREFVVETALNVAVHTAADTDPLGRGTTFGSAIRDRLYDLSALNERWASWKEVGTGWVVKLSFTANQIEHDARWTFDPKKASLSPINAEAIALSQQGEMTGGLVPRLRAVGIDDRDTDSSRFDSGAFDLQNAADSGGVSGLGSMSDRSLEAHGFERAFESDTDDTRRIEPVSRASAEPVDHNQTADLLEALRRRRGEREAASFDDESLVPGAGSQPSGGFRIVDVPLDLPAEEQRVTSPLQPGLGSGGHSTSSQTGSQPGSKARRGRTAMPSWDEIVFGARPDDDLA